MSSGSQHCKCCQIMFEADNNNNDITHRLSITPVIFKHSIIKTTKFAVQLTLHSRKGSNSILRSSQLNWVISGWIKLSGEKTQSLENVHTEVTVTVLNMAMCKSVGFSNNICILWRTHNHPHSIMTRHLNNHNVDVNKSKSPFWTFRDQITRQTSRRWNLSL